MAECITKLHKLRKGGTKKVAPRSDRISIPAVYDKDPRLVGSIEERFRLMFRKSSAGISLVSRAGRFVEVNPALCRLLGYTENELLELTCQDITPTDDHESLRRMWDNAAEANCSANAAEERYLRKDGSVLWGQVTHDWFYDREGKPLYLLTIMQDISARKRIDEELHESRVKLASRALELEAANRELESFNYTVSHDLRSPLTSLGGFCELLLGLGKAHLDDQCKSIIRHMGGTVRHMDQLIETLLNFSRISNREMKREPVNLTLMANTVAAYLKMREPQRQVEFIIAERVVAEGDAKLLREVLENLLGNSWKYTGKKENARIEFGLKEADGTITYYVRDDGPGFDMAHADGLFIPFHRLHSREDYAGYGIGLSTAQRIILRHGGRIWAEGKPGIGATFYFTLGSEHPSDICHAGGKY